MEEPDPEEYGFSGERIPRWHHYSCLKKELMVGGLTADMIPGFKQLKKADKDTINEDLGTAVASGLVWRYQVSLLFWGSSSHGLL